MEMKPEYSYSYQKQYTFWLGARLAGDNPEAMLKVLCQRVPYYQNTTLDAFAAENSGIFIYTIYDYQEYRLLRSELEDVGAKIMVDEYDKYVIAPANTWIPERTLTKLGEYSLALWAEANHIQEAYRRCTEPSFSTSSASRVWFDEQPWLAFPTSVKIDEMGKRIELDQHYTETRSVDLKKWSNLQSFMDQHFWTDENWDIRMGLDGATYTFEGWKNGVYKAKRAWSPDVEDSAHRADELFTDFFFPLK